MAVGDVKCRQGIDRAGQRRDGFIVADHPELMPHAVIGGDVERGIARRDAREHGVDLRRGRVAEHTGPVCAFTASIWRTRSSSLAGVVCSWRRTRLLA